MADQTVRRVDLVIGWVLMASFGALIGLCFVW